MRGVEPRPGERGQPPNEALRGLLDEAWRRRGDGCIRVAGQRIPVLERDETERLPLGAAIERVLEVDERDVARHVRRTLDVCDVVAPYVDREGQAHHRSDAAGPCPRGVDDDRRDERSAGRVNAHHLAGIGQRDAIVETHEELLAQKLLQVAHLLADRRRRHAEFFGGGDIASGSRRCLESAQRIQWRQ